MNHISERKHQMLRDLMTKLGYSNYKSVSYNQFFKNYYFIMPDDRYLVLKKWLVDSAIKAMREKHE